MLSLLLGFNLLDGLSRELSLPLYFRIFYFITILGECRLCEIPEITERKTDDHTPGALKALVFVTSPL